VTSVPKGCYYLADAGYKLQPFMMIPYKIHENMTDKESRYNYFHSRTRIIVEGALGRLKNVFRIYKSALNQKSPEKMASIITSTLILHNIMIDLNEKYIDVRVEDWMHIGNYSSEQVMVDDCEGKKYVIYWLIIFIYYNLLSRKLNSRL
jgi:hypothetical protein